MFRKTKEVFQIIESSFRFFSSVFFFSNAHVHKNHSTEYPEDALITYFVGNLKDFQGSSDLS